MNIEEYVHHKVGFFFLCYAFELALCLTNHHYYTMLYDTLNLSLFNARAIVLYSTCVLLLAPNLYAYQTIRGASKGSAILLQPSSLSLRISLLFLTNKHYEHQFYTCHARLESTFNQQPCNLNSKSSS